MSDTYSVDKVFDKPIERVSDFSFNKEVADVFDDMVSRSVPQYDTMQKMLVQLATSFATEGTNVYDLGCSTGTTIRMLHDALDLDVHFVGLDYSAEMLDQCRSKLMAAGLDASTVLRRADLNAGVEIDNASVVMSILTLMFVRPMNREKVIADIYAGLNDNGCLLLVEKVLGEGSRINRLLIEHYYEYKKKMGYSQLEISQKREALENVLIPYKAVENTAMLLNAGFREVDVFFRYLNFTGYVAIK